jgi:hypothetical protein
VQWYEIFSNGSVAWGGGSPNYAGYLILKSCLLSALIIEMEALVKISVMASLNRHGYILLCPPLLLKTLYYATTKYGRLRGL